MSEEQKDRFVAKGLGLLAINAPWDIVRCNIIPRDVLLLARVALGSLRGPERDTSCMSGLKTKRAMLLLGYANLFRHFLFSNALIC